MNFLFPSSSIVPMVSLKASSGNFDIFFNFKDQFHKSKIGLLFVYLASASSTHISPSGAFESAGLLPFNDIM